ncbi:hypothetical protein BC939DRAFT_460144 [Gamsiella multidivaricata]|uniref:uncharacterized protein n=1 Tax=Gamsiella multidivaricata TaxID=101098 RepID=UPI002220D0B9|nr:uncharacterized protein BC939DRAFT_460144 [Gamsiella multidivaricata]KAI7819400.1 hypothetical protein BC939DRAFT_460144 [Gamsiella multidivaricata]
MLWEVPEPQTDHGTSRPSWLRILIYTILFKCEIRPKVEVKCHDFNSEMLDNPAIKALLEYKWNTIGHAYWRVRFYSEFIFYMLVLGAVTIQVYGRIPRVSLFSAYIAIIVMASVFLMLKCLRFRRNRFRDLISLYGAFEVAVFVLPLVRSIIQILNIVNMDEKGDISFLSFSVLVIFLRCLSELRVKKNIGYFVTVILEIVGRIRLFFLLFSVGIVAFALAILYFLRGCPITDCGGLVDTKFLKAPLCAVLITFLFLSGIDWVMGFCWGCP